MIYSAVGLYSRVKTAINKSRIVKKGRCTKKFRIFAC